jgi:hypothetical protein
MKRLIVVCFMVGFSVWVHAEESEFRAFTSSDGRVIEARILDYNSSRNKLHIERMNAKKIWIDPSVFSESDRIYIKKWIAASDFLAKSKIRITIDKHKKSAGKNGDDVHYSITLQNRSKTDFKDLYLDYRFYVEGKEKRGRDRCIKGSLTLEDLPAGGKHTLNTKVERMHEEYDRHTEISYDEYGTSTDTVEDKVRDDDAQGIWFKIRGPKFEGVPLIREVWFPSELNKKVAW